MGILADALGVWQMLQQIKLSWQKIFKICNIECFRCISVYLRIDVFVVGTFSLSPNLLHLQCENM